MGEGSTLATACTSGVRNGKGPLSRTVAPCEPGTFVKDKGWSQKRGWRGKKSCFRGFYMCRLFQHMVQCLKQDNKGHNRLSWSEKILILPFISAAHVEFHYMDLMTCECRLSLWPWHCWWTSLGVRMWCIVLFLWCTSSNVTAFVDLWSKNVTPLSRFGIYFAFPSY